MHKNAKLTPAGRALLVARVRVESWSVEEVAVAMGVGERTVRKWVVRGSATPSSRGRLGVSACLRG